VCCSSACVDINTNADHCGGCDRPCPTGQVCESQLCGMP
jgi:hypothetical protein